MKLLLAALAFAMQSDTVRISERICSACEIRLDPIATLGDTVGPGMLTSPNLVVAQDVRGRFLVANAPSRFAVFSQRGAFLRAVGKLGGGPGEYRRIWQISPYANGILVHDDFAKRRTWLTNDFEVVDTKPALETPTSLALRRDGSGVFAAFIPTPQLAGYLLHDLDAEGSRTRSHSLSRLPFREDLRDLFDRDVSLSTDAARYWVNHRREYAFAHCRFGTESCRLYLRPARWFPAPSMIVWTEVMGTQPPPPQMWGVSQDSQGYVWSLTWVADERWRSAVKLETRTEYRIVDFDRYYDTILEAIDPRTNAVVARRRFDPVFRRFVGPGVLWRYREDDDGFGRIEIVRLTLENISLNREEK